MKSRKRAAALALLGAVTLPGIHRIYLGQPRWGWVYLLLAWKLPVSRIASAAEGLWYLFLEDAAFDAGFNPVGLDLPEEGAIADPGFHPFRRTRAEPTPAKISAVATALRDLEQLRQTGLITEGEFEQQRRALLAAPGAQLKPLKQPLDANQASVEDWLRLPDLSIHQARRLTELSQQGVQFHSLEDLAAALNLAPGQLQPWADRVQFCYYEPQDGAMPVLLDPNQASREQLEGLPGMTPERVQAWIQQRQQSPFQSLPDLSQRLRLPGEMTQVLMHYLKV